MKSPEENLDIPTTLFINQEPLESTVHKVLPRYYWRKKIDYSSAESS